MRISFELITLVNSVMRIFILFYFLFFIPTSVNESEALQGIGQETWKPAASYSVSVTVTALPITLFF